VDPATFSIWQRRCLEWQERDLEGALADFTFIADVTTLSSDCCFVGEAETLVARYDGLPFSAVAFHGDDLARIVELTRRLLAPEQAFYCLVGEEQWPSLQAAYRVLAINEEWQMVFRGDPDGLDPGSAVPLGESDWPEMAALAEGEDMMAFEHNPLALGPWYGVRSDRVDGSVLVAQGGTHLQLSRAAEVGNIVTAREHRRRGYASQVVSALVRALHTREKTVFLQVFKTNKAAIACYEHLGFQAVRTMVLAKCHL
jgi:ribosomal protein S18 acetylase RimI-like enzyme